MVTLVAWCMDVASDFFACDKKARNELRGKPIFPNSFTLSVVINSGNTRPDCIRMVFQSCGSVG